MAAPDPVAEATVVPPAAAAGDPGTAAASGPGRPRMPMGLGENFNHMMEAARQQTELIWWVVSTIKEHEKNIEKLQAAASADASGPFRRSRLPRSKSPIPGSTPSRKPQANRISFAEVESPKEGEPAATEPAVVEAAPAEKEEDRSRSSFPRRQPSNRSVSNRSASNNDDMSMELQDLEERMEEFFESRLDELATYFQKELARVHQTAEAARAEAAEVLTVAPPSPASRQPSKRQEAPADPPPAPEVRQSPRAQEGMPQPGGKRPSATLQPQPGPTPTRSASPYRQTKLTVPEAEKTGEPVSEGRQASKESRKPVTPLDTLEDGTESSAASGSGGEAADEQGDSGDGNSPDHSSRHSPERQKSEETLELSCQSSVQEAVKENVMESVLPLLEEVKKSLADQMAAFTLHVRQQVDGVAESIDEVKAARLDHAALQNDMASIQTKLETYLASAGAAGPAVATNIEAYGPFSARPQKQAPAPPPPQATQEKKEPESKPEAPQNQALLQAAPGPPAAETVEATVEEPAVIVLPQQASQDAAAAPQMQLTPAQLDAIKREIVATSVDKMIDNLAVDNDGSSADRLLKLFKQRMQSLDEEARASAAKVQHRLESVEKLLAHQQSEDKRRARVWDMEYQVEIIQSIIAEEMRHLKKEGAFRPPAPAAAGTPSTSNVASPQNQHLAAVGGAESGGDSSGGEGGWNAVLKHVQTAARGTIKDPGSPTSPGSHGGRRAGIQPSILVTGDGKGDQGNNNAIADAFGDIFVMREMQEKIRRLQECFQSSALKIAALKATCRTIELQATTANEKATLTEKSVEHLVDQVNRQDTRLDYFVKTGGADGGDLSPEGGGDDSPRNIIKKRGTIMLDTLSMGRNSSMKKLATPSGAASGTEIKEDEVAQLDSPREGVGGGAAESVSDMVSLPRFLKLAKKVSLIESDLQIRNGTMQEEFNMSQRRIAMIETLMPKRHRRMIHVAVASLSGNKVEDEEPDENAEDAPGRARVVSFKGKDKLVETRSFQADDVGEVPWQWAGEKPAKWAWTARGVNEMSHHLALHLQTMEDEQKMFEEKIMSLLDTKSDEVMRRVQGTLRRKKYAKSSPASPNMLATLRRVRQDIGVPEPLPPTDEEGASDDEGDETQEEGATSDDQRESMSPKSDHTVEASAQSQGIIARQMHRMDQVVMPRLTELDDRMNRWAESFKELKKDLGNQMRSVASKSDVQLLTMRVSQLENTQPQQVEKRLAEVEKTTRYVEEYSQKLGLQVQVIQNSLVPKSDITKLWQEISGLRVVDEAERQSIDRLHSQVISSNQKLSLRLEDIGKTFEQKTLALQSEKAPVEEVADVHEKVKAMETYLKKERNDLSKSAGDEVGVVVKRIILGMEDKLMLMEQRLDAGVGVGAPPPRAPAPSAADDQPAAAPRIQAEGVDGSLTDLSQQVQQLKHDVGICQLQTQRLELRCQETEQLEKIAQRISVHVDTEGKSDTGGQEDDASPMLSLTRVQVMISAAARQLVAGSKWVTTDMFNSRLAEMRKEYQGSSRQLQETVGELLIGMPDSPKALQLMPPLKQRPKLPMVLPGEQNVSPPDGLPLAGQALPMVRPAPVPSPRTLATTPTGLVPAPAAPKDRPGSRPWPGS